MIIRVDNRLTDAPMHPVECQSCGAIVHARKSSWQQTSVQWTQEAMRTCTGWDAGWPARGRFPNCAAMTASIAHAVVEGELAVLEHSLADERPGHPHNHVNEEYHATALVNASGLSRS